MNEINRKAKKKKNNKNKNKNKKKKNLMVSNRKDSYKERFYRNCKVNNVAGRLGKSVFAICIKYGF